MCSYQTMNTGKIICFNQVAGWRLNFGLLRHAPDYALAVLKIAAEGAVDRFRRNHSRESIARSQVVQAVRSLMGSTCTHESSFEFLAHRVFAGEALSLERPAEVFRDILSLKTLAPWSVVDFSRLRLPLTFRMGEASDVWSGPWGTLELQNSPVLRDEKSLVASPVICDEGTLVEADCPEILLVCYAPASVAREADAKGHLGRLVHMSTTYRFVEERAFLPQVRKEV